MTWGLLATGALTLAACSEQLVVPSTPDASGELLAAKKGGGKPGGGGGGGPAPSAEIAFHYNGSLYAMNADGTGRTALLSNGCSTTSSSWAPGGNGTTAQPFRIVNAGTCGAEAFTVADVDTTGGAIHVQNVEHVHFAGDWWDTQDPAALHYGQPAWKPNTGGEIALAASWLDAGTDEWMSALYLFPTSQLPSPTPVLLYLPSAGCTDAVLPAWSPDGGSIAFVESCPNGSGIKVLDVGAGTVTTVLASGVLSGFGRLDWSASGNSLAFSAGQSVYVMGMNPVTSPTLVASGVAPSWAPGAGDGQLAFNTTKRSKVKILDLSSGSAATFGSGEQPAWRR